MIKKLTRLEHEETLEFLTEEAALNLFIIGDIETFGYDEDFQELWGDFDDADKLRAVLLRFYDSYIPYSKGDFDTEGFIEIIKGNQELNGFSGKADIVEKFEKELSSHFTKKQITFFAECTGESFQESISGSLMIKEATLKDIDRIIALRETIKEFVPNPNSRDILQKGMETGTARTYYLEVDGRMAAAASTTAENSYSAMIVGVCTAEGYRKQGYASLVVEKLTKDVLAEGKSLCLFFDNPDAGRIYKRLGYNDIGLWTMYRK